MIKKDDVCLAYDELAETYAAQRPEIASEMEILSQFLGSLSEPTRILDAGCGQGDPVLPRINDVTTAIGVDFSHEQLRLATENTSDVSLIQGDMSELPFDNDVFDAVTAYWSLIHIPMNAHQTVIDEFARVLRPDGRVLLCEGDNEWAGEDPDWLDSGTGMQWNIAGAKTTRNQLQSAGFNIIDSWGVPEILDEDKTNPNEGDEPWTFFDAELDT